MMEPSTSSGKNLREHPREVYLRRQMSEIRQSIELLKALKTESDPKYSVAIEMAKEALYHRLYTIHRKLTGKDTTHFH